MNCKYKSDIPCIGVYQYKGKKSHSDCTRYKEYKENQKVFIEKIKTINVSSKAMPTRKIK